MHVNFVEGGAFKAPQRGSQQQKRIHLDEQIAPVSGFWEEALALEAEASQPSPGSARHCLACLQLFCRTRDLGDFYSRGPLLRTGASERPARSVWAVVRVKELLCQVGSFWLLS